MPILIIMQFGVFTCFIKYTWYIKNNDVYKYLFYSGTYNYHFHFCSCRYKICTNRK